MKNRKIFKTQTGFKTEDFDCEMFWDEKGFYKGQQQPNMLDDTSQYFWFKAKNNENVEFKLSEKEMNNAIERK